MGLFHSLRMYWLEHHHLYVKEVYHRGGGLEGIFNPNHLIGYACFYNMLSCLLNLLYLEDTPIR